MTRTIALLMSCLLSAAWAGADEIDDLVRKLNPPQRFASHQAKWSTSKEQVTFEGRKGPETWTFWFIRDAEGVVAVMPTGGFHGGTIYMQDFRPGSAPRKVPFPRERWHIDTAVGTEIRTNNFIPEVYGETDPSYQWTVDGPRLVLVRTFKGESKFNRWAHRTKSAVKVDAKNTIVFRVDPQLGYVVDASYDIWTDQPPASYEYSSAATSGRYLLFPGQATCFRHAITRAGESGISGYACNHGCTKQHSSESCRQGGFVSFLNDETGWSPTLALVHGSDAKLGVCGAHTDLDFVLTWPKDAPAPARDDGLKHNGTPRLRLLALPPELTRHVWGAMKLLHEGERKLMIRLGQLEDFEEQPLELTTRQRGMPWNAQVTEKFARSGKKAMVFSGRSGHGDPQINLLPSTTYLCEAWVKVVEISAEETQAADAARGKGKAPTSQPSGPPQAWISGWIYEWSPHVEKPIETYKSNVVGPSDQWQKVSFQFTTPPWGPFIQLDFHGPNATVCLDDFRFLPLPAGSQGR